MLLKFPLTQGKPLDEFGIGREDVTFQYQDHYTAVSYQSRRYGVWGRGKALSITHLLQPLVKVACALINKTFNLFLAKTI
jgi:hypothetical protein